MKAGVKAGLRKDGHKIHVPSSQLTNYILGICKTAFKKQHLRTKKIKGHSIQKTNANIFHKNQPT